MRRLTVLAHQWKPQKVNKPDEPRGGWAPAMAVTFERVEMVAICDRDQGRPYVEFATAKFGTWRAWLDVAENNVRFIEWQDGSL